MPHSAVESAVVKGKRAFAAAMTSSRMTQAHLMTPGDGRRGDERFAVPDGDSGRPVVRDRRWISPLAPASDPPNEPSINSKTVPGEETHTSDGEKTKITKALVRIRHTCRSDGAAPAGDRRFSDTTKNGDARRACAAGGFPGSGRGP